MNDNEQRDELATVINGSDWTARAESITAAILAAGYRKPRTITTVEELDALAEGSVVRETDGRVTEAFESWNRDESSYGNQFLETGTSWRLESREITLPATVLHEPTTEATQ